LHRAVEFVPQAIKLTFAAKAIFEEGRLLIEFAPADSDQRLILALFDYDATRLQFGLAELCPQVVIVEPGEFPPLNQP